jgi:hypothetical protein
MEGKDILLTEATSVVSVFFSIKLPQLLCTRYPQGNQGVERIKCLSERRYKEIKRVKKEKIKIKGTPLAF